MGEAGHGGPEGQEVEKAEMRGYFGRCWGKRTVRSRFATQRLRSEQASPALHACVRLASAALMLFGTVSLLYAWPCVPAACLGAQQPALASGLAHHRGLGVLPAQAEGGKEPWVG